MPWTFRIISLLIYSSSVFGTTSAASFPVGNATSNCVNTFPPLCTDDLCYSITIKHIEGKIFRLGCLSSLNTNESLACKTALFHSIHNSTCIESGDRRVCCCFSAAEQYCNSIWKPFLHLPNLNSEEVVLLIIGVVVIIAVFYGLNNVIKFATAEWGAEATINGLDKHVSFELNIGIIKVVIIMLLLMSVWYPVLPECQNHDEGVFEENYLFIPQLLNSYTVGLYFCIYPVLLGLLDLNRLWYMSMRSSACRTAHTFVSMSATFLSVIPVTVFLFPSVELYRREMRTTYCKLGKNLLRIAFCILLYAVYSITALVQEIAPFFIGRSNDTPVWTTTLAEKPMLNDNSESEQLHTAKSETVVETADALRVTPRPFVLDNFGEGVLSLENLCASDWITLRILVSAPRTYTVYPQKVIIPPKRNATVTVRLRSDVEQSSSREAGLMLQWFSVGRNCPYVDVIRLWQRPFIMPRSRWKFYVLPVYHELEDTSDRAVVEKSPLKSRREH